MGTCDCGKKNDGTIYVVYENYDKTEGRGPMIPVHYSGYFTDEDEAWAFADTLSGVMGRRPFNNKSWRDSNIGDVEVRAFYPHDGEHMAKLRELDDSINKVQRQLDELQAEMRNTRETLRKKMKH